MAIPKVQRPTWMQNRSRRNRNRALRQAFPTWQAFLDKKTEVQTQISSSLENLNKTRDDNRLALQNRLGAAPARLLTPQRPAINGIQHPMAALALIKHYENRHIKPAEPALEPESLAELKTALTEGLTDDEQNTVNEALNSPSLELRTWLNDSEAALTLFATSFYCQKELTELQTEINALPNLPENTEPDARIDEKTLSSLDHPYLFPLPAKQLTLLQKDKNKLEELAPNQAIDSIAGALPNDETVQRLTRNIKAHVEQLDALRSSLEKINSSKLYNEYEQQCAELGVLSRKLTQYVEKLTADAPDIKQGISGAQRQLTLTADYFATLSAGNFHVNTSNGAITYWERTPQGELRKKLLRHDNGKGELVKASAADAREVIAAMSLEYGAVVRKKPTVAKDGSVTFHLKPGYKDEFLARLAQHVAQNNKSNRDRLQQGPTASATQIPTPRPS